MSCAPQTVQNVHLSIECEISMIRDHGCFVVIEAATGFQLFLSKAAYESLQALIAAPRITIDEPTDAEIEALFAETHPAEAADANERFESPNIGYDN